MSRRTRAGTHPNSRALTTLLFLGAVAAVAALVQMSWGHSGRAVPLERTQAQAAGGDSKPALTARGRQVFLRDCAWCHGNRGQGTQYAPQISDAGGAAADFWLSTGRMPLTSPTQPVRRGRPAYPRSTIDALVAYVDSLGPGPAAPNVGPGDPARGRTLFIENCAPCHSSGGTGMVLPGGQAAPALYPDDRTEVVEAMRLGPGSMPSFARTQLDDQQAADVAAYVQQLGAEQNKGGAPLLTLGPISEGFLALAVALPILLIVVRLLGKRAPR